MPGNRPISLTTKQLITACGEEAARPRSAEEGFCLELFRRAIDERDEAALAAVETQYQLLIISWLTRNGNLPAAQLDDLVQETWLRLWSTLTRESNTVARRFDHTGALLSYLKRCAGSALLEARQRRERATALAAALESEAQQVPDLTRRIATLHKDGQLDKVRRWVRLAITDEAERIVYDLSFAVDMKPADIARRHPEHFRDAADVYRIKKRILTRAKRALQQGENL